MCGLQGAFGPISKEFKPKFHEALDKLKHRGPDDSGHVELLDEQLILGHRRLSILDLSKAGHQPMTENGDWLVFNGEIYNHKQLRLSLLSNHSFNSNSDTETLLKLLSQFGLKKLNSLDGMFAGAWYQKSTGLLTLFRDSLGIKPLYYSFSKTGALLFASEIKALIEFEPNSHKIDENIICSYLATENYSPSKTFFQDIVSLELGEIRTYKMVNERPQLQFQSFVEYENNIENSDSISIDSLEKAILSSVESHLLADVPVGVYLSGGIDSSIVAAMASKKLPNLKGYTGFFRTNSEHYDERPIARLTARKLGIDLNEIEITPDHLMQNFDKIIESLDQPRMGMGSFSQFVVAKEASNECKVILAGHGGDELFAGYPLHKIIWLLNSKANPLTRLKVLANLRSKEWPWLLYAISQMITGKHTKFAPQIWKQQGIYEKPSRFMANSKNILQDLDRYYQQIYIPGLLHIEDRISMHFGLETRVPLWSQKLVATIPNISLELKLQHGQLKFLLKQIAKRWLPSEVLTAPKRGFPTPLRLWFKNETSDWVAERLLGTNSGLLYDFIPKKRLENLLHQHKNVKLPFALDEIRSHKIWTALCLESWLRQNNKVIGL